MCLEIGNSTVAIIQKPGCLRAGIHKTYKLALLENHRGVWLRDLQHDPEALDLEQWTEDSGISSDDTLDYAGRLGQSSADDSRNNSDEHLYKEAVNFKMKERGIDRLYDGKQPSDDPVDIQGSSGSDRASPPLYEVELTASDEDDDASVLELVIPMQSSRYQRVPTSSPKKTKPKVAKRYFCSLLCCGRRRK